VVAPTPIEPEKPAEPPTKADEVIDFSSINPETEWECFGTFDKNHHECQKCPFAAKCEAKKISKAKK
jgi:hypothetical protein